MAESYLNGKETLWEKEKLLVTSNFSFSHSVFKRLVSHGSQKVSLCGNELITKFVIKILQKEHRYTVLTLSQTTNFRLVQTESVCRRQF